MDVIHIQELRGPTTAELDVEIVEALRLTQQWDSAG